MQCDQPPHTLAAMTSLPRWMVFSPTISKANPPVSCFKYLGTGRRKVTNAAMKLTFAMGTGAVRPHLGRKALVFDPGDQLGHSIL